MPIHIKGSGGVESIKQYDVNIINNSSNNIAFCSLGNNGLVSFNVKSGAKQGTLLADGATLTLNSNGGVLDVSVSGSLYAETAGSWVVGVKGKGTITIEDGVVEFTLLKNDGTVLATCRAENGMTFDEWVVSDYRQSPCWVDGTTVYVGSYKSSDFTSATVITNGATYHMTLNN